MSRKSPRLIFRRLRDISLIAGGLVLIAMTSAGAATISGRIAGRSGPRLDGPIVITATQVETGRQWSVTPEPDGSFLIGPDVAEGSAVLVVSTPSIPEPLDSRVIQVKAGGTDVVLSAGPLDRAPATFTFQFYKTQYYNNKANEEVADLVHVTAPSTTPNINFSLTTGGGSISGRVTNEAGTTGLPNIIVFAIGMSSGGLSFDRTNANGDYQITGIPADSFMVSANLFFAAEANDYVGEYYNNATSFLDLTPVVVTEGNNTPNINFGLALGGTISGRITAESGGAGIPFANVTAELRPPAFESKSVVSDASGFYTIRGLPANAQYVVLAEAAGFVGEFYNNKPDETSADNVPVTSGGTTPNINLALTTGAKIQGTVRRDVTNDPLKDLLVVASRVGTTTMTFVDITDSLGHYSIEDLPAGSYTVSVPEIGKWYNNQTSEGAANPVTVTTGQVLTGINFTGTPGTVSCAIPPGTAVTINGRVTTEAAAAVPGAEVSVIADFGGFRVEVAHTETDASGNYTIGCLQPLTYVVFAKAPRTNLLPEYYNNADSASATPVVLTAGQTANNINFALAAGGAISGKVTIHGTTTPLRFVMVNAKNIQTGEEFETFTDVSGNYTLNSGDEGGMRTGDYKVWTAPYSTVDFTLVPVVLARFEAFDAEDGIAIEWSVEGDDVSGYHVYRSNSLDAAPVRLTDQPLGSRELRYLDTTADVGVDQSYWLGILDRSGVEERFGPVTARRGEHPILTQLLGPRPNPVRSSSEIGFSLARSGRVTIRIHDLSGRLVRTLVDQEMPAGAAKVQWDTRSDAGQPTPSGIYYLRLAAGGVVATEKVIVNR